MDHDFTPESEDRSDYSRWQTLLGSSLARPEEPIIITTLRRAYPSSTRPIHARGIDKQDYVIKGRQTGRQIINEQVVARLGKAMNAPVADPKIVEVSSELLESDTGFDYFVAGTAHGVCFVQGCSDDRETIQYVHQNANRERFALLSVLYGWAYAQDHQFIYQTKVPNLVFSVDHGHFFPGGPNWTVEALNTAPDPCIDKHIYSKCKLSATELQTAMEALASVEEQTIVQAVASPPETWGITMDERIALLEYLLKRREKLLSSNLSINA